MSVDGAPLKIRNDNNHRKEGGNAERIRGKGRNDQQTRLPSARVVFWGGTRYVLVTSTLFKVRVSTLVRRCVIGKLN